MARSPTLAVFTKNRVNPAYTAARLAVDRVAAEAGGRAIHYVPETPDDVGQQKALAREALAARPDAVVFNPADDVAMQEDVARFADAGIPAWWLGYLVMLARPLAAAGNGQEQQPLEWYPIGRIVMWAAILAAMVVIAAPTAADSSVRLPAEYQSLSHSDGPTTASVPPAIWSASCLRNAPASMSVGRRLFPSPSPSVSAA